MTDPNLFAILEVEAILSLRAGCVAGLVAAGSLVLISLPLV